MHLQVQLTAHQRSHCDRNHLFDFWSSRSSCAARSFYFLSLLFQSALVNMRSPIVCELGIMVFTHDSILGEMRRDELWSGQEVIKRKRWKGRKCSEAEGEVEMLGRKNVVDESRTVAQMRHVQPFPILGRCRLFSCPIWIFACLQSAEPYSV